MSMYNCTIRTNYFHVKDPESFRRFMDTVYCGNGETIDLWEDKDAAGNLVFGFGAYGAISGIKDPVQTDDDDGADSCYDDFIAGLQEQVADDDAIIIFEAGHEKMRYVVGRAEVITQKSFSNCDITTLAISQAMRMLKNPHWTTKYEY